MALILHLETATKTCSVALSENGQLLQLAEETSDKFSHAEKLNFFIEEVMKAAGKSIKDLEAVAISAGPGSYTGLRIGTSSAKGICYALDIPLISINSLKALASLVDTNDIVCPMFDARRMEVYTALYRNGENLLETQAMIIDEFSFTSELSQGKIIFVGPGAEKCQEIIQNDNAVFDLATEVSAKGMIQLALEKFKAKDFEDLAYFEPAYLKDFIAGKPKKLI
ncbi:tRNA (adenosine(37)-N6)-threonylcarbamoyltransferase complex dimerization subunit type 1 TsaB [Paracrocinitomix mangrovi]|uniref:tRNA (adenosine(37)-N6)-threonylcarbamoyltransferase complex dimerization subunit type 1 TsaB n=1 Tax=Paracrocinitomix mangrovi TaxID=2862509 RepID=UPI001C8ED12A|nr:tRNA (adenosine(37)-N6)-threonylcarbamoyltransferase complex dimerization subunit type 1 TsaB [Paracrocinitomix mangrovi]UKN03534.1 tRNA (adenosine(37)-N6)-threonylcarbamoyltransferase complex dimerization subunit type 1 TsaB [Paracrocinitomix mangrovi]